LSATEANFDGLVGPTHNYAGLSPGNLASARNKDTIARPRAAALQGLAKMKRLAAFGLVQGVLPPHERPFIPALRRLGFTGSDAQVWEKAWAAEPLLARQALAASSMWAANAATISPSADCADARLHATPANLVTMAHRALESRTTTRALRTIFADEARFAIHDPLPAHEVLADEGAANHMRLCDSPGAPGLEIFIYGRGDEGPETRFPARQAHAASRAVARRHDLAPERTIFARQSRAAIEAGAFHNDVVAVSHQNVLLFHERAFEDRDRLIADIERKAAGLFEPMFLEVSEREVPLADAVGAYLFNGQLIRTPRGDRLTLILPEEARANPRSRACLDRLAASNGPIGAFEFIDVRESMRNGGGPACLRLRVALSDAERTALRPGFLLDDGLAAALEGWIMKHYRESLAPPDLADPSLLEESRRALDELTRILPLGNDFFDFQRR
jgi:succinylarginine dihydrolase